MLDDKNLKQQILNSVNDDDIPNFSTAIKAKYSAKQEKAAKPWYRSGKFWGLTSSLLTCGIVAVIVIPMIISKPEPTPIGPTPITIQGKTNEIAFGVMSASNLIPDAAIGPTPLQKQRITEDKFKNSVTELNSYMGTAEAMIENNLDMNPIMVESDDPNYTYLMQINNFGETLSFYYKDLNENHNANYILNDLDDDDDFEDNDEDDLDKDSDDEEQEYSYVGILKKENITYPVNVKKELEKDEYELSLTIQISENSYIAIEQEFEQGEQSYTYKFVENGNETLGAEISFECEDNETIVELELLQKGNESAYTIKKEINGFVAEYEIEGYEEGLILITINNGEDETTYTYKEKDLNYSLTLKRS